MIKNFWIRIAYLGACLLENNGFWIDKVIGYNLACFGLKRCGFEFIMDHNDNQTL